MRKIFIVLLVFLLPISFLVFHDKGNEFLRPYFSDYLESKLVADMKIELSHLKIDLNHIEFNVLLNESINIDAKGELCLFTQALELVYTAKSNSLENKIDINGTVKGSFSDMYISGEGEMLKSNINYAFELQDDLFHNVKIKINNADIASLLRLTTQAAYARGKVDINVDIVSLEKQSTKSNVKILLHGTVLNPKTFKEELNIDLPRKIVLGAKLEVEGTVQRKDAKVYVRGKSKNFGGEIVFKLKENKLNVNMNAVDIEKLLRLFGEKSYARGKIMANIELHDLKKGEGTFNFKTKEAKIVNYPLYFFLKAKGRIMPEVINMEAKLDSDMFHYRSSDIKYKLSSKALSSSYFLEIPKLSKLNAVIGKRLRGKLNIKGGLNYKDEIIITGNTQNLGGNIDFKFKAQKLNAKINNVSVEKLMEVLIYPQVFKAKLVGDFTYDLSTSSGRFISTLNQAELLNTYLTEVIKEIRGVNLPNERYAQTYFNAIFHRNLIYLDFKAQSKTVLLLIPSGQINKSTNKINAYYKIKVDNQKLEGRIRGDLSDPKITLDSSKYIQNKMMNMMEDNMGGFFN